MRRPPAERSCGKLSRRILLIPSITARTAEDSGRLSVRTQTEEKNGPANALLVWDAGTGAEIRTIPRQVPKGWIKACVQSRWRSRGGRDPGERQPVLKEIKLWQVDSGREVASFPLAGPLNTAALNFSPDGETLAAVAAYPTGDVLHVWDAGTARSRYSIPLRSRGLRTRAAFSPDGRRIACVLNGLQIGVWDAAEGKPIAMYQDDMSTAYAIAFGRNGRDLLAADS